MTVIVILAAGESTRLGRPKQTLQYEDQSLLKHTIKAAVDSDIGPVIVVIGSNEKEIHAHIENDPISIVLNNDFHEGIGSSIRTGISHILEVHKDCDNVILMVCDQPYVTAGLLKAMIDTCEKTNKPIVACSYKNTIGVPSLFDKRFFPELLSLTGEEGGKMVLLQHEEDIATVPFPEGEIDIDTMADYEGLIK
jgi:molybdenum cofactor cytidylyltransferase